MTEPTTKPQATISTDQLIVDLGPLIIFILTYVLTKDPIKATAVFMAAMAVAMIYAKVRLGSIPVLLIISGIMVIVFGSLTIYLHDQRFIQMKPSIYYGVVSLILFYGTYTKKPLLKHAMGAAYPDLSDKGWHILGRNFAWFFLALMLLNEFIRHAYSFSFWSWSKLWLFVPLTLVFGGVNIPMIMRESEPEPAPLP